MTKTIKQTLQTATVGQEITLKGWVRTTNSMQNVYFININDGSQAAVTQIVVNDESKLSNLQDVKQLTAGCSIAVTGVLIESKGKGQDFELHAINIDILGGVEDPATYPMPMKRHTNEYLRDNAHLRPRTNIGSSVARVRNAAQKALHDFFEQEGFLWCSTPLITASDCEGAGEMFKVSTLDFENIPLTEDGKVDYTQDFFGQQTGLTVSGQLNAETYACALTKVFTFGPTFRAENSNTSRHLSEFWMVEPEVAFADMNDAIALSERMLKFVIKQVMEKNADDIDFFNLRVDKTCKERLTKFIENDFIVCDYTDAIDILQKCKHKFDVPVEWGMDLGSEHERYLAEQHYNAPVALTNYPKDIKSFYMRQNDDGKTVAAFDVLAPGIGEIIGGSQREERLDVLLAKMEEKGLSPEDYSWYLDLRKYGTVPHSGYGLGFERLISYITGVQNVRDTIPFPRTPKNISF
jgi:asparaginyl-tRNA synthetase